MRCWMMSCALCLLLAALPALAQDAYTLAYKDTVNTKRVFQIEMTTKSEVTVPGDPTETATITQKFLGVEKVTAVKDGKATIEAEIKNGTSTEKVDGETTKLDIPAVKASYRRDNTGKYTQLKVNAESEAALEEFNATVAFGGEIDPESMTSDFEFPTKALKIGEGWKQTQVQPLPGGGPKDTFDLVTEYTLTGTKEVNGKTCLVIGAKDGGTTPKRTVKMGDDNVTISVTYSDTTSYLWDNEAGEIVSSSTTGSATISMTGPGEDGKPLTVTMKFSGSGTVKRVANEKDATKPAWGA